MSTPISKLTKDQRIHLISGYKRAEEARLAYKTAYEQHCRDLSALLDLGFSPTDIHEVIERGMQHYDWKFNKEGVEDK